MATSTKLVRVTAGLIVSALLGAAFLAAFALLPTPRASAGPGDFTLSGTVTDNATSLPIAGAVIHIDGNTLPYQNETMTNATGWYWIELPAGNYLFAVAHGSYWVHLIQSLDVTANATRDVALDPAPPRDATIRGFVVENGTGLPLTTGRTTALTPAFAAPTYINFSALDGVGYYEMDVIPGEYRLDAEVPGYQGNSPIFTIASGETRWENMSLDPQGAEDATFQGYVLENGTGLPIAGAFVSVDMGPSSNGTNTDGTGYYMIGVASGSYRIAASAPMHARAERMVSIASTETRWENFTLLTTNSTVKGYITETGSGNPIAGAYVFVGDMGTYGNSTTADPSGYYEMRTIAGSLNLGAQHPGYQWNNTSFSIADGETRWVNVSLLRTNSTVRGYITEAGSGNPLAGAFVGVGDMMSYGNSTTTDPSGYYEMRTIAATLFLSASLSGYMGSGTSFSIADGETRWVNHTLDASDAWIRGYVWEFGTGNPLAGVDVRVRASSFPDNATTSDGFGYYELAYLSGSVEFTATLGGYQDVQANLDLAAGDNWYNVTMYPILPDDAAVQGFVFDIFPIAGARVRAEGFGTWFNETLTDVTGFYAMNVVAANLTLFTRATGHAPDWTAFGAASGQTTWVNITLAIDSTPPSVSALGASPAVNVSTNNPTTLTGQVNETWLDQWALSLAVLLNASGGFRNFTWLTTFPETGYSFQESSPGIWDLDLTWDAQIPAGHMGNASGREWVPLSQGGGGPWSVVSGEYRNASNPTPVPALALFNPSTGALEYLSLFGPPQPPGDPTGEFRILWMVLALDPFDNTGPPTWLNGTWFSVVGLDLVRDDLVSSGTYGFWLQAWDYGDSYDDRWSFVDVDTDPPVADAGPDQGVLRTQSVTFDGSASTDNVGIVNYTWTFTDGGPRTLYGSAPSYTFNAAGVVPVTLAVRDGAWNPDSSLMTVTVTTDGVPPVANAGPDQTVDQGALVTFDGSASTDNIGISNYTWTFTDGSPRMLYGVGPSYLFANPGSFVVTLAVWDLDLNPGWDNVTITVNDTTSPVADAGVDRTVNEDTSMAFDGSASTDNVGIANYTWTFTDGGAVTRYGVGPTYVFNTIGNYVVTLTVRDAAGNSDTDTMSVAVLDATFPIANAGPDRSVNQGALVTFDGSASTDDVGIVNYTWTFTDGGAMTRYGVGPTYTFNQVGAYVVTLTVRDGTGNTHVDTMTVTVLDVTAPVANAGADVTVVQGATVTFVGTASTDNVGIVNYTWTFTDGSAVTLYGSGPTHVFAQVGTYVVTLTVRDAAGNTHTDTRTVTTLLDTDGDGTADGTDTDDDGDGMPDTWETQHGFDPLDDTDASGDPDGDGLTNLEEFTNGSDPRVAPGLGAWIWALIALAGIGALLGILLWRRRGMTGPPKAKDADKPDTETDKGADKAPDEESDKAPDKESDTDEPESIEEL